MLCIQCLVPVKQLLVDMKPLIQYSVSETVVTPFSHTYTMLELRKCFLHHNWIDAVKLLLMMLDGGSLFMKRIILKVCMGLL